MRPPPPIAPAEFRALRAEYRRRFGFDTTCCSPEGARLMGARACRAARRRDPCGECRKGALAEALRWGEPCVSLCPEGLALWAVPLMHNGRLTGGLVVAGVNLEAGVPRPAALRHIRAAAQGLLEIAEARNCTNAALLDLRRLRGSQERERAEAIHEFKTGPSDRVRRLYLVEEPALLAAIGRGETRTARATLQRILAGARAAAPRRTDLLRDIASEILVMMSRAAIDAGAEPAAVLGSRRNWMQRIAAAGEERLATCLADIAERLAAAIPPHHARTGAASLARALAFIEKNAARDLRRDEVARVVGLSPSHFSRLLHRESGCTFTELLNRRRVENARHLLARTRKSLVQIALECGFCDQSYFTKVFRRHAGSSPLEYRRTLRLPPS